jgi:hypothetical protein
MYELRYAFSIALWAKCSLDYKAHGAFFHNELRTFIKAGLMGARPLPEFYYLIYLISGIAGLVKT